MVTTPNPLTKEEIQKLYDEFSKYPDVQKTIAFMGKNNRVAEAVGFLRDMQQIADLLAIGEADSQL